MTTKRKSATNESLSLADGALDTLGCVFQTMGRESFALDSDTNLHEFSEHCLEIARHVEHGSAAPAVDIDEAEVGTRQWGKVRRFFVDRRKQEKSYVVDRLGDYRGIVEQFTVGLRDICVSNDQTERTVTHSLESIEQAVSIGSLPDVERVLASAINDVGEAFARQKQEYEQQIAGLNERMDMLRDDLVAAKEETQLDALTNVFNRRAFDSAIQRYLNTRIILSQPVSIVMIDVDNFKSINDRLGHTAGDALLKFVADCLTRSFIRKNDLIARYGGDEFVVILPDTTAENSATSIRRFLDAVQDTPFGTDEAGTVPADGAVDGAADGGFVIRCSAGCTEIRDEDTMESLIQRADSALYEAKGSGRNCFKVL